MKGLVSLVSVAILILPTTYAASAARVAQDRQRGESQPHPDQFFIRS